MNPRKCSCGRPVYGARRKCARCIDLTAFTTTTLRPSKRGANKVGIAAHKPDKAHTRGAKRQYIPGNLPVLRTSSWL